MTNKESSSMTTTPSTLDERAESLRRQWIADSIIDRDEAIERLVSARRALAQASSPLRAWSSPHLVESQMGAVARLVREAQEIAKQLQAAYELEQREAREELEQAEVAS